MRASIALFSLISVSRFFTVPSLRHGHLPDGYSDWDGCPCSDEALCKPISKARPQEDVYAFHSSGQTWGPNNQSWKYYDWTQITTVCVFGKVDPELLCHAHSVGARVTLGYGGPTTGKWNDSAAVAAWINTGVRRVQAAYADGLNLDVEIYQSDKTQVESLTAACKLMADTVHKEIPGSHVSVDVPSEGETGSIQAACGQMYGRDYDYKALAEAVDFFVVMDYDSNDAQDAVEKDPNIQYAPKWQQKAPGASPYIYTTRSEAAAACSAAGFPRLCRKEELVGFSKCSYGWASDWEGYWMASSIKGCGNVGFNPSGNATHVGPAGAYCCGNGPYEPCPTCFFANAALPVVKNGVDCFQKLGVPASKLVLAFSWYGYDYTCRAGDAAGGQCHVTAAAQTTLVSAKKMLAYNATSPGRVWQANSSTPHFFYTNSTDGTLHRVDYDDSESLRLKYQYAKSVGARGVGMWTASALNYTGDPVMGTTFWDDLKQF